MSLPSDLVRFIVEFKNPYKQCFDYVLREMLWEYVLLVDVLGSEQPSRHTKLKTYMKKIIIKEYVFLYVSTVNTYFEVFSRYTDDTLIIAPITGMTIYTESMTISKEKFIMSTETKCVLSIREFLEDTTHEYFCCYSSMSSKRIHLEQLLGDLQWDLEQEEYETSDEEHDEYEHNNNQHNNNQQN